MNPPGGDSDHGLYRARSHRQQRRAWWLFAPVAVTLAVAVLVLSVLCGALGYARALFL